MISTFSKWSVTKKLKSTFKVNQPLGKPFTGYTHSFPIYTMELYIGKCL
jgi:hypothetical protein